jgi:16S rRNA processing protein RimM
MARAMPARARPLPDAASVRAVSRIVVGRCGSPHGVRGWIHVQSYTDPPENLIGYAPWIVRTGAGETEIRVAEHRAHRRGFVVRFEGCEDRDAAERLRGSEILVDEQQLPPTEEDEYYWKDLIGLRVFDTAGRPLGEVTGLMDTAGHDLLVVRPAGGADVLIPFVRAIIVSVDLDAGRLVADWDPDY